MSASWKFVLHVAGSVALAFVVVMVGAKVFYGPTPVPDTVGLAVGSAVFFPLFVRSWVTYFRSRRIEIEGV